MTTTPQIQLLSGAHTFWMFKLPNFIFIVSFGNVIMLLFVQVELLSSSFHTLRLFYSQVDCYVANDAKGTGEQWLGICCVCTQ